MFAKFNFISSPNHRKMKKIFTLFAGLFLLSTTFAASTVVTPKIFASQVMIPISAGKSISLLDLSQMKVKDFENLSGRHLNLLQRITFSLAQKKLRKSINEDGTVNSKKLTDSITNAANGSIPKGLYIVLAIFGLAWIAMGVMDDWSGNDWWINLILTLLFWLPGFIHAMIKMGKYYK